MAHNKLLVITTQEEGEGTTINHEKRPLLTPTAKKKQSFLSKLKDQVFVKSKAANMILLWNLLVSLLYGIMLNPGLISVVLNKAVANSNSIYVYAIPSVAVYGFVAICLLFYPLAGYVGDVCVWRYKAVRCSLWTIWITVFSGVIVCGLLVLIAIFGKVAQLDSVILFICIGVIGVLTFIVVVVGFAGFRANVIQLGMDQLLHLPAKDSTLFILWFIATLYTGVSLGKFAWSSLLTCYPFLVAVGGATFLVFLFVMPISLCVGHCKHEWFVLNPRIGNPYKLIRQVTSSTRQHKMPVQRSTYWEENIQINLGRNRYGGLFTTEQVENVNTFFGVLKVLFSLGPFFMSNFAASEFLSSLGIHMGGIPTYSRFSTRCSHFQRVFTNGGTMYPLLIVLLIVLYVLIPQRYVQKYTPSMLKRVGIGLCLITVSLVCSITMDTVGHIVNPNATCIFFNGYYADHTHVPTVSLAGKFGSNFLLIQNILTAVAYILIYGGMFEFICAESSHSTKGLLLGIFYAIKGLFQLLDVLFVLLPFIVAYSSQPISFSPISCGFGYYLVNIIISIIGVIAFTYTAKKYQYRPKDEFCDDDDSEDFYDEVVTTPDLDLETGL